jgi:uncharacterized protein YkwD
MKYYLFSIIGIFTTILGIATTAQADLSIQQPHRAIDRARTSTPHPTLIWHNGKTSIIGTIKSRPAVSQPKPTSDLAMNSLEISVYHQVNRYRQSLNLPPLVIDPTISAQARAHSEQMARTGNLSHRVESAAQKIAYPSAAENIATSRGYRYPDLVAIQGWITSPRHHHYTIGRYNLTGIGVAKNARGEYYFTQIFIYKRQ